MTDIADLTGDDDWLSAAEVLRRVEAVMGEFRAKLAIATRAHDGLVRTRAERFIKQGETIDDAELPKEFWWAEGHEALEQNWVSGDFSTWINKSWEWKAFGVRFHRDDIAKLIPPIAETPSPALEAEFVPSTHVLRRVVGACGDEVAAATMLLEWVKAGELSARVKTYRVAWEGGPVTSEKDKLLSIEDWDRFEEVDPLAFKSGIARTTGWDSFARNTVTVRMTGLHFEESQLAALLQTLPARNGPTGPVASAPGDDGREWVSARDAVYRIMGATQQDATKSLYSIVAYAKTGDVQARTLLLSEVTHRQGYSALKREERNAAIPVWFWQEFTTYGSSALNWKSGVFAGEGFRDGRSVTVTLTGVQFDARGLDILDPPKLDAAVPTRPVPLPVGKPGRPAAAWWDDLLIEMFRRLWEDSWTPRTKTEVVKAMHDWLAKNPGDDPLKPREASDTVLKARAKKLFDVLELGQKSA